MLLVLLLLDFCLLRQKCERAAAVGVMRELDERRLLLLLLMLLLLLLLLLLMLLMQRARRNVVRLPDVC